MKIGIIGSAPSSINLAPFDDPSWTLWGCSEGAAQVVGNRKVAAWFEIHDWPWSRWPKDYQDFLLRQSVVYTPKLMPELPNSVAYPFADMTAKYGAYFWTCSPAYMLAMAIDQKPEEIGIWGIDMAAADEWAYQRPACHFFIGIAQALGIKVTVPPQSDLLVAPSPYGFNLSNPMLIKLEARKTELQGRLNANTQQTDALVREAMFFRGALDDIEYTVKTWVR
jgi:hypothetical protein